MADAALVRESLVDAALMNGAVVSGKMAAGDGGMTAAQHAELRRMQRRSVRAITGTNKATSTAAIDAEMGIISLELATAIKVMQWWARMRAYPSKAPIRRTVAGLTKRELRRVRRSDKSTTAARMPRGSSG